MLKEEKRSLKDKLEKVYEAVCDWWDESAGEVFGMDWGES